MNRRSFLARFGGCLLGLGLAAPVARGALSAEDLIRDAITRRRRLRLTYAGHSRMVEPHALGVTPGGHRAIVGWQFGGTGRTSPPTGWRTFRLNAMSDVQPMVRSFTVRADYRPHKIALRTIELDVQPEEPAGNRRGPRHFSGSAGVQRTSGCLAAT